jgi:hypothetical protein
VPEIKMQPGTKLTPQVREAIAKKLEELEKQADKNELREGTTVKIHPEGAMWSVTYNT